jgi:hypothetical protein
MQDQLMAICGQDQIGAGALVFAIEQEMRVRDDDRIGGRMRRRRVEVHQSPGIRVGMRARSFKETSGVGRASVIQRRHHSWLISGKSLKLEPAYH